MFASEEPEKVPFFKRLNKNFWKKKINEYEKQTNKQNPLNFISGSVNYLQNLFFKEKTSILKVNTFVEKSAKNIKCDRFHAWKEI